MRLWLCTLSAVVMVSAGFAVADSTPDAARRAELTYLVLQDCGSCHGMTLKGGLGSPLLPANLEHLSSETLAAVILDGVPGTPMPPWRGELSPEDALWIAGQLKEGFAK